MGGGIVFIDQKISKIANYPMRISKSGKLFSNFLFI